MFKHPVHGLAFGIPRPFKKGIACHGSMHTLPLSHNRFVDLYNDTLGMNVVYLTRNQLIML